MSDQDPQAPNADTPDTPEQQPGETAVDYHARYVEAQAWGTRASQEAAEYRRQIEALRSGDRDAFAALGLELDEQDDTPEYEDPYEAKNAALEARIAAQEQRWEEQRQTQEMQSIQAHLETGMAAIPDLTKDDHEWVALRALNLDPLPNGMPDVQAAYEDLRQRDLAAQKRWAASKRAPHVSPAGQAGTQQPAFSEMTREQKAEWMAQRNDSITE